jgi:hypothetical protein
MQITTEQIFDEESKEEDEPNAKIEELKAMNSRRNAIKNTMIHTEAEGKKVNEITDTFYDELLSKMKQKQQEKED